jgi:hypothetical protein
MAEQSEDLVRILLGAEAFDARGSNLSLIIKRLI